MDQDWGYRDKEGGIWVVEIKTNGIVKEIIEYSHAEATIN